MKARENLLKEKDELKTYLAQVNRDWNFLKVQLIFVAFVLIGLICLGFWLGD